jgi:pilus assembly protein CpaB
MRAVSVKVDEVRGVAGFILPGDRVDVVLTRAERTSGQDKEGPMADVLLQNVKVLAIDQLVNEQQDKPTVARAVTLELNVQQAQKVILAEGVGRLSLILRQAGEVVASDTRRVTLADLGLTEVGDAKEASRISTLELQLEEMRKAATLAESAAKADAAKRIAELEEKLRNTRVQTVPAAVALPKRDDRVIVNVIRGISKRDEYSVVSEAR